MAYQTNSRVLAAIKREGTIGVAAGSAGGTQMRVTDSPGLKLTRAAIQSNEKRSDGLKSMMRLGGKSVGGSYNGEATVGPDFEMLLESIMRGTWRAALVITEATASAGALTVNAANQLTRTGGSWITDGVRVGDVVTLTNYSTAGDNNLRLRVTAVTALVITVAGTPLTIGASDAAWTLTILKKLVNPASPTRYSHSVEQYAIDTDLSELFLGCRLVGLQINCPPNAHATWQATFMGLDRTVLQTGTSPYFTSPSLGTGIGLIADDSAIRFNGAEVSTLTGFSLNFQIAAAGQPVIGSVISPDIFDNDLTVTGTISGLQQDFATLTLYDNETEFELGILLYEPESDPKDCISIYLPRVKLADLDTPFGGGDGARVETRNFAVGPRVAASGYDAGYAVISSSGA